MLPYYFLVLSPIAFSRLTIKGLNKDNHKKRIISFFFIVLLFLLMFRAITVGRDLGNYRSIFEGCIRARWQDVDGFSMEPAWFVLNKLVGVFTSEFQWVLIVVALICIIPFMYTYNREIEYPILTISIFIIMSTFVMLFSGLRQAIAISLGMIAFEFTKRHRLMPFLLIAILAFLFHKSAFMLLFMYPLYHARITKKWLWLVIPIMSLIFINNESFFAILTSFISDLYEGRIQETGAYTMLILFVLFCIFAFIIPDEGKLDDSTVGMRNFLLFATVIQMFAAVNSLAMRMGYYYIIFIPLLIPKIIKCSSVKYKQIAWLSKNIMIVFFIGYFLINMPASNALNTFPYHFFWENNA